MLCMSRLLELPANLHKKAFMTRTLHHFCAFKFDILLTVLMNLENDNDSRGLDIWCLGCLCSSFFFRMSLMILSQSGG